MERYDSLYDVSETAQVRFMGLASEQTRHDFGIVFTHRFDGKPLVVCMQTGQSTLLSSEDAIDPKALQRIFRLDSYDEAQWLAHFFKENLPNSFLGDQY